MMKLIAVCALVAVVTVCMTASVMAQQELSEPAVSNSTPTFHYQSTGRDPFVSLAEKKREYVRGIVPEGGEKLPLRTRKLVTKSDFTLLGLIWTKQEARALISWPVGKERRVVQQVREGTILGQTGYRVAGINSAQGEVLLSGSNEVILLHVRRAGG